ncbi:MAG: tRNA uridine(34) 5-carboxymethylaminomethyl modification radical SAM/GNAT enzyme Elp3 [Candidatus Micrarchaeia archaeon]
MEKQALEWIIRELLKGKEDIEKIKRETTLKFSLSRMPRNSEILALFPKNKLTKKIKKILFRKPSRTASGVTPIALMIKPESSCRWGCIYCPRTHKAPKSYTGEEPAALRARGAHFDPIMQIRNRLKQYEIQGHPTDKCEVIIMGGTFLAMDKKYKEFFVKSIYDTLNQKKSRSILHAKKLNERAKHRVVGLTIETRPDVCIPYIKEMLDFGATRVELGVQNPDNRIYEKVNRGHTVKEVVDSTTALKNAAYKIVYHIMLGLPGSNPRKDIEIFKTLFSDERFQPDMLKIYPTLVIPGTELYELYKEGKYTPYSSELAAEVIAQAYRYIPEYARVMRIQRDIPANLISTGVKKSNLRELVEKRAKEIGKVWEIRAREPRTKNIRVDKSKLFRKDYKASRKKEIFLSYEDEDRENIFGFVRLRIGEIGLIRELHVYGGEAEIGKSGEIQHKGIGKKLMHEAEEIAKKEFGLEKMRVMSGAGVREYYYNLKYETREPYVEKLL